MATPKRSYEAKNLKAWSALLEKQPKVLIFLIQLQGNFIAKSDTASFSSRLNIKLIITTILQLLTNVFIDDTL